MSGNDGKKPGQSFDADIDAELEKAFDEDLRRSMGEWHAKPGGMGGNDPGGDDPGDTSGGPSFDGPLSSGKKRRLWFRWKRKGRASLQDAATASGGISRKAWNGAVDDVSDDVRGGEQEAAGEAARQQQMNEAERSDGLDRPGRRSIFGRRKRAKLADMGGQDRSRAVPGAGLPPLQVIVEWMGNAAEKDVVQHARGYIQDHFGSLENAWIATAPFMDGHFFEIHEGGDGRSHLPAIVEALTEFPDQMVWLSSGSKINRAITVSVEEGVPSTAVLNEDDTRRVRESGHPPLQCSGRMQRAVRKGERTLAAGATIAGIGFVVMGAAMIYSLMSPRFVADIDPLNDARLPINQIEAIERVTRSTYLERFVFEDGSWRPTWRAIPEIELPPDVGDARAVIEGILAGEIEARRGVRPDWGAAEDPADRVEPLEPPASGDLQDSVPDPAMTGPDGAGSDLSSRLDELFGSDDEVSAEHLPRGDAADPGSVIERESD